MCKSGKLSADQRSPLAVTSLLREKAACELQWPEAEKSTVTAPYEISTIH